MHPAIGCLMIDYLTYLIEQFPHELHLTNQTKYFMKLQEELQILLQSQE